MCSFHNKLITHREKRETSTQNLQRNNVARQVEGFCISYFAALTQLKQEYISREKFRSIFISNEKVPKIKASEILKRPKHLQYSIKLSNSFKTVNFLYEANSSRDSCRDTVRLDRIFLIFRCIFKDGFRPYCELSRVCLRLFINSVSCKTSNVNISQLLTRSKFKVSKQPPLWMRSG